MTSDIKKPHKRDMTKGDIMAHVVRMALPMTIGIGAIISFSLADTYFIGQLGATELAAIGYTFPVTTMIFNIVFGMAIAMSAVISRKIGAGDSEQVRITASVGITISVLTASLLSILGYVFLEPIFKGLGAGDDVMPIIRDYMPIWFIGAIFLSVPVVANSALRGTGDGFWPAFVMVMVAVVNIILDPILIFGLFGAPRLEVQGAAIASMISYIVAMIAAMSILICRENLFSVICLFCKKSWQVSAKPLLAIAIPVALANLITPLTSYGYTMILSNIGDEAVAAYGVASRVEAFALIPIMALAGGIAPLIGQNYGAGLKDRVGEALGKAIRFALFYGIACAVVSALVANSVASAFSADKNVIAMTASYLIFVPISYFAMNVFLVTTSAMNALGKPKAALVLNIIKAFVLAIPLSILLSHYFGMEGFIASVAITNIVCGISYFYLRSMARKAKIF